MKKHQKIGKLAEMGGSVAEVNPRTPYTLPQARILVMFVGGYGQAF